MSFLSQKQKDDAVHMIEDAGRNAKELNAALSKIALGKMDKATLAELPHRIAAINAQVKAGIGKVGAHVAFTEASTIPEKLEQKRARAALAESNG